MYYGWGVFSIQNWGSKSIFRNRWFVISNIFSELQYSSSNVSDYVPQSGESNFFEIGSEDLENDTFCSDFWYFDFAWIRVIFLMKWDGHRVMSVFNTDLSKEVNFPKSMFRDFKLVFRTAIFQFQHVGLCSAITLIKLFRNQIWESREWHVFLSIFDISTSHRSAWSLEWYEM